MKTINVKQGSDEWLELRKSHFTASDAPAMMGVSKYKSRKELLEEKLTGKTKPISDFTQNLFNQGHQAEEAARPMAETIIGDELYPATGITEIEDLPLLASFDGITLDETVIFEHKLFNKVLAEDTNNNLLEPHYLWQIAQQLLVSGAETCLFITSDGTSENFATTEITPQTLNDQLGKDWQQQLIQGWKQFQQDLEEHKTIQADDSINLTLQELEEIKQQLKTLQEKEKQIKQQLQGHIEEVGADKVIADKYIIEWQERKGSIDYAKALKKVPKEHLPNLDDYRRKSSKYLTIKERKAS